MDERQLGQWLREARSGRRTPRALIEALRRLPYDNLGVARLDTHRPLRRGAPEIVFGEGKRPADLIRIVRRLGASGDIVVVTRLGPAAAAALLRAVPGLRYDALARIAYRPVRRRQAPRGLVLVVTGGTADLPVAAEAALTLELLGSRVSRLMDVGVAGLHRVLHQWRLLRRARAIVVIAGMEGALPSVVAGLVRCPVIAVPTSVGYGASFQGVAPLLTMMNSCVPGIGVVNIDNGFGGAYLAHLINAARG